MQVRRPVLLAIVLLVLVGGAGVFVSPRLAGLNATDGELELIVNIAARRLDVIENGERTRSYSISPGAPQYRTPLGEYRISTVIWNPWWRPPNSEWARGREVEPPGLHNPMGRVKLNFDDLLYIHGTPLENELGEPASHGCIRMANADVIELARLVHKYASPKLEPSVLDKLAGNPTESRSIRLQRAVPLHIQYQLAEVRDGRLEIHRDVYKLTSGIVRKHAVDAVRQAGLDPDLLRTDRLDSYLTQSPRGGLVIPLDRLLQRSAGAAGSSP